MEQEIQQMISMAINNGYQYCRYIPGKGVCGINMFMYTFGLCYNLDDAGYEGRYCYENIHQAIAALTLWDGTADPMGNWIKHKGGKGEYSNPNYKP